MTENRTMSMQTWEVTGIGFQIEDADPKKIADVLDRWKNTDIIKRLNKNKTPEGWTDMTNRIRQAEEYEDVADIVDSMTTGYLADILASGLNKEYHTTCFEGSNGDGDSEVWDNVLWVPAYPWTMNDTDKTISEERVMSILKWFANSLGCTEQPDNQHYIYVG